MYCVLIEKRQQPQQQKNHTMQKTVEKELFQIFYSCFLTDWEESLFSVEYLFVLYSVNSKFILSFFLY